MFIESPENIELVIHRGLVKVVAPLLFDAASSVRNAAAGALRNFSTLKTEACEALMEQDVMTPLIMYFHEVCASNLSRIHTVLRYIYDYHSENPILYS